MITDGTQTFVMYTYQCGLMEWSGEAGATVNGSRTTIGYNLGGEFHNHPLTRTAQPHIMGCISQKSDDTIGRRQASKWHNHIYQLPTTVEPMQQLRSECMRMRIRDIQSVGDIQPLSRSLGACPSTLTQMLQNPYFVHHTQLSTVTSRCYVHLFSAGDADISSLICCYSEQ